MKNKLLDILFAGNLLFGGCAGIESQRTADYISKSASRSFISQYEPDVSIPIPEKLNGARKVDYYMNEDSSFTLVHIRNEHESLFEWLNEFIAEDIEKIQGEIYDILNDLNKKGILFVIFPEGVTTGHERAFENYVNNQWQQLEVLKEQGYFPFNEQGRKTIWKELHPITRKLGGMALYGIDNSLTFYAAEHQELNRIASEEVRQWKFGDNVCKNREDFLLGQVLKYTPRGVLAVTDFGASHNFKDNIKEWNKSHPNKQFSLIVITPKSLKLEEFVGE